MKIEEIKKQLEKQGHRFIGKHGSVKICNWTRKSLVDEGCCYKEKFYGIDSWRCCQMSPWLGCENKCLHCWRPIEVNFSEVVGGEIKKPKEIIDECIKAQINLLTGFKGNEKVNVKKLKEAWEPNQFAISLMGEGLLYPRIGEFILELRKRNKTSFLVTNGLCPFVLKKLSKEGNLPTQLYISMNTPDEQMFKKWHRSSVENAWKKFNESLKVMRDLNCRTVVRMTLVKNLNMNAKYVEGYVKLIKKASPDFVEVKGYVSVGFARKRLGYEMMPTHNEVKKFSKELVEELHKKKLRKYKILNEHIASKVVLIGKDKKNMRIKKI